MRMAVPREKKSIEEQAKKTRSREMTICNRRNDGLPRGGLSVRIERNDR